MFTTRKLTPIVLARLNCETQKEDESYKQAANAFARLYRAKSLIFVVFDSYQQSMNRPFRKGVEQHGWITSRVIESVRV
jgi:hypothetical protein